MATSTPARSTRARRSRSPSTHPLLTSITAASTAHPTARAWPASSSSARRSASGGVGAAGVDVDGVQRLAGGHEQAIALGSAEADVGTCFGQQDLADARTVGGKDVHAVVAWPGPTRGGPDVAVDINPHSVRPD